VLVGHVLRSHDETLMRLRSVPADWLPLTSSIQSTGSSRSGDCELLWLGETTERKRPLEGVDPVFTRRQPPNTGGLGESRRKSN